MGRVASAMIGVHILVGIGEGLMTAMAVSAVLTVRPDLVHGASHLTPALDVEAATVPAGV